MEKFLINLSLSLSLSGIRQTSRVPRGRNMQRKRWGWRRGAPGLVQCRGERGSGTVVSVCLIPDGNTCVS